MYNNNILTLCNHYNILSSAYFYTYHTSFFSFEKLFFPKFSLIKYTMSHSTNSNVNFCDVCGAKKGLYRHQSYGSKHKESLEKMFGSDYEAPFNAKHKAEKVIPPSTQPLPENMERLYDPEEEYYFLRSKPQTESKHKAESKSKTEIKSKTESKLKNESIPKDNIKDIIKTKPITKPKPKTEDSIYSRMN